MTDLIRRGDAREILEDGGFLERSLERLAALPAVTVGVKPWGYCPECGCEEPRFGEGPHKQCARCYQEWFTDIDYSEVVRCNLQKLFIAAFAVTPKVKPLVWKETYEKVPKSAWASHTGFGRWFIVLEFLGMNHAVYRLHEIDYPTLDAAKAAAQRDYTARILAALEPATPEPCEKCSGSGLVIGDGGDPRLCPKCKGDTVQAPLSPAVPDPAAIREAMSFIVGKLAHDPDSKLFGIPRHHLEAVLKGAAE